MTKKDKVEKMLKNMEGLMLVAMDGDDKMTPLEALAIVTQTLIQERPKPLMRIKISDL